MGGTTDSPTFAGLRSAGTCTGAAQVHGAPSGRTDTLSWPAATDPGTPSSGIGYDISFAASSGGENFASPIWTTAPWATADRGNLVTSGSAYFVVRARDGAGHEDTNTVERLAVNSC